MPYGKIAIVIGSGRDTGRGIDVTFANEGAKITLNRAIAAGWLPPFYKKSGKNRKRSQAWLR